MTLYLTGTLLYYAPYYSMLFIVLLQLCHYTVRIILH